MLLHRYNNIDYIMSLDVELALELIHKAKEKTRDERFFLQWLVQLPNMTQKNYVSFSAYKDRVTGANIDKRPTAEILAELDELEKQFKDGNGD